MKRRAHYCGLCCSPTLEGFELAARVCGCFGCSTVLHSLKGKPLIFLPLACLSYLGLLIGGILALIIAILSALIGIIDLFFMLFFVCCLMRCCDVNVGDGETLCTLPCFGWCAV